MRAGLLHCTRTRYSASVPRDFTPSSSLSRSFLSVCTHSTRLPTRAKQRNLLDGTSAQIERKCPTEPTEDKTDYVLTEVDGKADDGIQYLDSRGY
jgi:hypothetical protein